MMPVHEGFHQFELRVLPAGVHQLLTFSRGQSDGLLTQHMFPRFERLDGPLHVQMVGQRIVDRIHIRVGQQRLVRSVTAGNRQFTGHGRGAFRVA